MAARRPLVAVVDDEESVRRAVARMLVASHFDVETFASGQEFLDAVQQRRPDCVILDFQMPGLTGREVFTIRGLAQGIRPGQRLSAEALREDGSKLTFQVVARLDTPVEVEYYRNGGILQTVLRNLMKS